MNAPRGSTHCVTSAGRLTQRTSSNKARTHFIQTVSSFTCLLQSIIYFHLRGAIPPPCTHRGRRAPCAWEKLEAGLACHLLHIVRVWAGSGYDVISGNNLTLASAATTWLRADQRGSLELEKFSRPPDPGLPWSIWGRVKWWKIVPRMQTI